VLYIVYAIYNICQEVSYEYFIVGWVPRTRRDVIFDIRRAGARSRRIF
jgi:hypothetical protein